MPLKNTQLHPKFHIDTYWRSDIKMKMGLGLWKTKWLQWYEDEICLGWKRWRGYSDTKMEMELDLGLGLDSNN